MNSPNGEIQVKTRSMRLCTYDCGDLASIPEENVLIYWPHGFGDLVGLGYVLPLLEPSNRYWITRFGDDYISIMDGSEYVTPIFVGGPPAVHAGDGESLRNRNFGLVYNHIDGGNQSVSLPLSIYELCRVGMSRGYVAWVWIQHSPAWYDEPKECSIHLIGSEVTRGSPRVQESISGSNGLSHRTMIQDSRIITGEQALGAVETLLY